MTRVLLADDHPMIRTALEVLLRDTSYELAGIAGTGEMALAELERLEPDILLLDLQMPGGSGIETIMSNTCGGIPGKLVTSRTSFSVAPLEFT